MPTYKSFYCARCNVPNLTNMVACATIHPMRTTSVFIMCLSGGLLSSGALAQSGDADGIIAPLSNDRPAWLDDTEVSWYGTPMFLRMQGADLSLITNAASSLPNFDVHHIEGAPETEQSPLSSFTPISDGLTIGSDIHFDVQRSTTLQDGGIAGSHGTLSLDEPEHRVTSLTQSEGQYDIYDLALSWEAIAVGPVSVNLLSGIKAIDGQINKLVTTNGTTTLEDAQRVAAIPVVGTGIEWQLNDQISFAGTARTHPIDGSDSMIDVHASTEYHISHAVDLSVGYSLIRSNFEIGSVGADITREGLFARLQFSF